MMVLFYLFAIFVIDFLDYIIYRRCPDASSVFACSIIAFCLILTFYLAALDSEMCFKQTKHHCINDPAPYHGSCVWSDDHCLLSIDCHTNTTNPGRFCESVFLDVSSLILTFLSYVHLIFYGLVFVFSAPCCFRKPNTLLETNDSHV